jgi:hypothetical protein
MGGEGPWGSTEKKNVLSFEHIVPRAIDRMTKCKHDKPALGLSARIEIAGISRICFDYNKLGATTSYSNRSMHYLLLFYHLR